MEAPFYPPAQAWEEPVEIRAPLNTRDSSLADFLATPFAKRIFETEIPDFAQRVGNPAMAMHLSNLSPRNVVTFGMFKSEELDRVDAKLKAHYAAQGGGK